MAPLGRPAHGINRGFLHYALSKILKQSTLGANSRWNLLPWQTLRPEALKLGQLNPRTAKANLKIVLEAYKNEGLDLYGIININEMASKEFIQY